MQRATREQLMGAAARLIGEVAGKFTTPLMALQFGMDLRTSVEILLEQTDEVWGQIDSHLPLEVVVASAYYQLQIARGIVTPEDLETLAQQSRQLSLDHITDVSKFQA